MDLLGESEVYCEDDKTLLTPCLSAQLTPPTINNFGYLAPGS